MNDTPPGRILTAHAKPPRYPVRNSDARAEIIVSAADASFRGGEPAVQVRCGACDGRLFDVMGGNRLVDGFGIVPDDALLIIRKCPSCDLLNEGWVTGYDGRRLTWGGGLAGAWRCECGRSLGYVKDVRGRIHVTCRCKHETRVIAANAISVAYREAA